MSFEQLSPDSKISNMHYNDDRGINLGRNNNFTATAICPIGTPVKLNSDGTVSPVAAVTDFVFGIVVKANRFLNTDPIPDWPTILTPYSAIIWGVSDAGSTTGAKVACSGQDATTASPKFKTAVTTNYVIGQALETATNGNRIHVGIYYQPALI